LLNIRNFIRDEKKQDDISKRYANSKLKFFIGDGRDYLSIQNGVKRVVYLSTDKAVYPINAMRISKAMMETVMVAKSLNVDDDQIVICDTRYGNVMTSRGSVIPLFIEQIRAGAPLTLIDRKRSMNPSYSKNRRRA
jgi:UDP-glucose 4-epimerase